MLDSAKCKVLTIDIETTMCESMVFRTGKQVVSSDQLVSVPKISCVTYKQYGKEAKSLLWDREKQCDEKLLSTLSDILVEAHLMIGHNFGNFDYKFLQARAWLNGLPPIPSVEIFDTYREAKKIFNLPSLKLDYLCKIKFGDGKSDSGGIQGFINTTKGCLESLMKMVQYNQKDVYLNEQLFLSMLPYANSTINVSSILGETPNNCPSCGSSERHARGYRTTKRGRYQRYQCNNCGAWYKGSENHFTKVHSTKNSINPTSNT